MKITSTTDLKKFFIKQLEYAPLDGTQRWILSNRPEFFSTTTEQRMLDGSIQTAVERALSDDITELDRRVRAKLAVQGIDA